MSKKFILVRHGDKVKSESTNYHERRNVCLTTKGIAEIEYLSIFLSKKYPSLINSDSIYSSPYPRAIQTAEILRRELDSKEIFAIQDLEELYTFDDYSMPEEIRNQYKLKSYRDFDWVSPQTNISVNQQCDKFQNALSEIYYNDDTEYSVVSTHGGIIRSVCYRIESSLKQNDDSVIDCEIHTGSYTILEYLDNIFSIVEYNNLPGKF